MGNDYGCICSQSQDTGNIPVPDNDNNPSSNNIDDNSNKEIIPKKENIVKASSSIKYNEHDKHKFIKIQCFYRRFKANHFFKQQLMQKQKLFDTNILNFGEYITESQLNCYLNPEVKQIQSRLNSLIPSKAELNHYFLVFSREAFLFKNNTVYKGNWNYNGKKHGYGIYVNEQGAIYEGFWINDVSNGRGRYIDQKGYYEGQWVLGECTGKGTLVLSNGYCYDGDWQKDTLQGTGKELYEDGNSYEGLFKFGLKEGKGIFKWSDGSQYQGIFTNGRISGQGKFKWKDGREYDGLWENNSMNGKGIFTWPNGKKYDGEYQNNKKQGTGSFYWTNDLYYIGNWLNNQQHGDGVLYQNGKQIKGVFRYGKLIQSDEEKPKEKSLSKQKISDSYNQGGMKIIREVSE